MFDNKISAIIEYKLPDYVREDYPLYVAFIKAYFEFLEEEGGALHYMERFRRNLDPDLADADFLESYRDEFAGMFPKSTLIPTSTLIKLMKEFYLSKGSEDSFRFIFTILYNTDIDIIYPREQMYIPSNGEYTSDVVVYITGENWYKLNIDNTDLSASIEGVNSGSTAVIDTITTTYVGGKLALKLELSSYDAVFDVGEQVILSVDDAEVIEIMYGCISDMRVTNGGTNYKMTDRVVITDYQGVRAKAKITKLTSGKLDTVTITDPGTGYAVGDLVKAARAVGSQGYGFRARVYEVGEAGEILRVRIEQGGYNYDKPTLGVVHSAAGGGAILDLNGDDIGKIARVQVTDGGIGYSYINMISVVVESETGSGAELTPEINTVFIEPKRYVETKSAPSGISKILDSYYYQQFSYVISSSISPHRWLGQIKRIAHPAGTQLFGMYRLNSTGIVDMNVAPGVSSSITRSISMYTGAAIPDEYAAAPYRELERYSPDTCQLGLVMSDIDKIKFLETFEWTAGDFFNVTIADISGRCSGGINKKESSVITVT